MTNLNRDEIICMQHMHARIAVQINDAIIEEYARTRTRPRSENPQEQAGILKGLRLAGRVIERLASDAECYYKDALVRAEINVQLPSLLTPMQPDETTKG